MCLLRRGPNDQKLDREIETLDAVFLSLSIMIIAAGPNDQKLDREIET